MARSPLDRDYPLRPDADVLFSARSAPLGEWFLTVATSTGRLGFASVLLTEARPSRNVEIVLDDNDVSGSVRVDGRTKSGIAVFLMHEQSLGVRSTFSSSEGAFAFSGAQPGRYLLMTEGQVQAIRVPLVSGPLLIDIEFGEAGIVVVGADRALAPSQAGVELWPERLGRELAAELGVLRRYLVEVPNGALWTGRIPTGNYGVRVDLPSLGTSQASIQVGAAPKLFPLEIQGTDTEPRRK